MTLVGVCEYGGYPLERLLLLRGERREAQLRAGALTILHLHSFSTLEAGHSRLENWDMSTTLSTTLSTILVAGFNINP